MRGRSYCLGGATNPCVRGAGSRASRTTWLIRWRLARVRDAGFLGVFTEGFDTANLKDARALLDGLG